VYPHKNVETLIEAFAQLNREGVGASTLVIVGKRDYFLDRLQKSIEKRDISPRIVFRHNVSDQELSSLYQQAAALTFPSTREGFGLPVLEALSMRCPVIASDIPALREVGGNFATYVAPDDVAGWVSAMKKQLVSSETFSAARTSDLRQYLAEFSWGVLAQKTLDVYNGMA
jgi:glycosyltransferase involved in cell wall biosynthesis